MNDKLKKACALIKKGKAIIFPTETVYGLGVSINYPSAIETLFKLKQREKNKPLQILVADRSQIYALAKDISPAAQKIIETHLPGPLTVLLFKSDDVPDLITAGSPRVGIRLPDHEMAVQLIAACGPLVATSANLADQPPATTAAEAMAYFPNLFALDGGPCKYQLASTVIDLTLSPPKVLRPGPTKI
jgi:L-threonylcarbamoyladenylate synthase